MRKLSGAFLAVLAMCSGAAAAEGDLSGTIWTCTRARDGSQFVITFYPDGGVGGGEWDGAEISPYVFDASRTRKGRWPGEWKQIGSSFTWAFPDQHMEIEGSVSSEGGALDRIAGIETAMNQEAAVECRLIPRLPPVGLGLVVPKDGHFMDPDGEEGILKVPTGISLPTPDAPR